MLLTLDELNTAVSLAIVKAEHLPDGSDETKIAWLEVSRIEGEIAKVTHKDEIEGRVARRGAITAAITAGDKKLAEKILTDFISQGNIDPQSIEQVRQLLG